MKTKKSKLHSENSISKRLFLAFVAPALVLTVLFTLYPLLNSISLMFQRYQGYGTAKFVGLMNIENLFTDPDALNALINTFFMTFGAAAGTVLIGTALAVAFYNKIPLTNALKFFAFLPVILPPTLFALAWKIALDPTLGWINPIFRFVAPDFNVAWLSETSLAMPIVIFVSTIQYVGIPMILMLSAMNDIPDSVNEAATLDGVSPWQRIRLITLPLTRDVLITVIGIQIIGNFKALDTVYALTKGGPALSSDVFATFIYRQGFEMSNFGYASAAAFFGTLVVVLITLLYTFYFRPKKMTNQ